MVGCGKVVQGPWTSEQNWGPLSEVMWSGTPNLATQPQTKASAMVSVVVLDRGMASNQLEEQSTMVRRWLKPSEEGIGG